MLVPQITIGRSPLVSDVDCHVSRSYWMITFTCHVLNVNSMKDEMHYCFH